VVTVLPPHTSRDARHLSRAHLADGRIVAWVAPPGSVTTQVAIDAELAGQRPPPALSRRFGPLPAEEFWRRWTGVEVVCKILEVPVVRWLHRHGLDAAPAGIVLTTHVEAGIVVTVGALGCDNARLPDPVPVTESA
jgi:hypothetical protein